MIPCLFNLYFRSLSGVNFLKLAIRRTSRKVAVSITTTLLKDIAHAPGGGVHAIRSISVARGQQAN